MSEQVASQVPQDDVGRLLAAMSRLAPGVDLARVLTDVTLTTETETETAPAPESASESATAPAQVSGLVVGAAGGVSLRDLDEGELGMVAASWERLISWARAAQARVARELMDRTDGILARDSAAGEIAAYLSVTTNEAWQIAARGEGVQEFPVVGRALAGGRIDAKKADTFLRAGAQLTPLERGEAIEELLPHAPGRTWRWLSEQMNAAAARLHGRAARRRDVTDRCNVWVEPAGPGMGRINAELPVTEVAVVFNAVQAGAAALKDVPGETRPRGALRAAALTALVTGRLILPCASEEPAGEPGLPGPDNDAQAGPGSRAGAGDGPARLVEPVRDTDMIPVPRDIDRLSLTGPADTNTDTDTNTDVGVGGTRVRVIEVPATVHVTVPASVLADPHDMTPGILEGIGPIPADDAARIAADGTWRRLVTDPVSGVLTDYSTRTYTPGTILRAAVRARDQACTFPGCDRAAATAGRAGTDLDHIIPFQTGRDDRPGEPGQTRATNLHPLCRKHHNLKTHARWRVTRDPDTGVTRWTAPSRHTHSTAPTVVDPVIRYGLAHALTLATPPHPRIGEPGPGSRKPDSRGAGSARPGFRGPDFRKSGSRGAGSDDLSAPRPNPIPTDSEPPPF